jgi:hypothetical protein
MGFENFLRGIGLAAGRNIEWGQRNDLLNADIALKQQQVQSGQADIDAKNALIAARASIGQQIAADSANTQQTIADPKHQADIWGRAEAQFTLAGDNEGAIRAGKLHDDYQKQTADAAVAATKEAQESKNVLSSAALNFRVTPSPENAAAVSKAAIETGINPLDLPPPGSKQFATWAKQYETSSMTGKEHYDALEKEREFAINKKAETDRLVAQEADKAATRALRAQVQAGIVGDRKDRAEDKRSHTDFLETEKLNTSLQAAAKPYLDDRERVTTVKGLLAVDSSEADRQVRQALTGLLGHFKGRSTNLFYQDSKTFGDVVQRLSGWTSQAFTGRYDEATRYQLGQMLDKMEKGTIDPAISALEANQKAKAKRYGLDDGQVEVQGDFSRTTAANTLPAPAALERRVMKDGTILEKQADGSIKKVSK